MEVNVKVQFFKWAGKRRNFQHDSTTYMALIHCLDEASMFGEMWRTIQEMARSARVIELAELSEIIRILGRAKMEGRIEDAIKIFNEMSSLHCTPNMVTYNTIIKVLFESRAPASEATTWFEKMKVNGIVPNSFTYSILIDGFCKTNRVENALLLLEEMDDRGFPLCPAAYCSLINSLGKAKQYEATNELFQELKEN
ncbi:hypothetical protein C1H46_011621 [Malus baccata]|uniref:Pentacotripeptide-repeat region of PRORP domain-containing protein n=1 Tax=Malus baccata TaxID=106549 RepID=A0A540MVI9_MALBA|nr:hypothetical protein C1H46_011621 [Malus baccata]